MTRSLKHAINKTPTPAGVHISILDPNDDRLVHERAMAQIDAFNDGEPTAANPPPQKRRGSLDHFLTNLATGGLTNPRTS
jgi:hypothetical protein